MSQHPYGQYQQPPPPQQSNTGLIIAIGVLSALLVGGAVVFVVVASSDDGQVAQPQTTRDAAGQPAPAPGRPAPAPAAPVAPVAPVAPAADGVTPSDVAFRYDAPRIGDWCVSFGATPHGSAFSQIDDLFELGVAFLSEVGSGSEYVAIGNTDTVRYSTDPFMGQPSFYAGFICGFPTESDAGSYRQAFPSEPLNVRGAITAS